MPTYLFSCQKCGDFEQWMDINGPMGERPPCPDCGENDTAKVYIAPAISFHGSGFYSTDKK